MALSVANAIPRHERHVLDNYVRMDILCLHPRVLIATVYAYVFLLTFGLFGFVRFQEDTILDLFGRGQCDMITGVWKQVF